MSQPELLITNSMSSLPFSEPCLVWGWLRGRVSVWPPRGCWDFWAQRPPRRVVTSVPERLPQWPSLALFAGVCGVSPRWTSGIAR